MVSLEGRLPIENYVVIANHVNRHGIDGIFLTAMILLATQRWTVFITNPVNAVLRLLVRFDLALERPEQPTLIPGHSNGTAAPCDPDSSEKQRNVGFFRCYAKSEKKNGTRDLCMRRSTRGKKSSLWRSRPH